MSAKRRVVYDTRFIAATYYPKNEEEAAGIRRELTGTVSRSISSVTIYEIYKLSLEAECKQTAELRIRLLRQGLFTKSTHCFHEERVFVRIPNRNLSTLILVIG